MQLALKLVETNFKGRNRFVHLFIPSVEDNLKSISMEPKEVLLYDNAPWYATELVSSSGLVKSILLPPNMASIIQLMDQTAIRSIKQHYRLENDEQLLV